MPLDAATLRDLERNVSAAIAEDIGDGDLTAALVDSEEIAAASIIAREALILAGQAWADEVFRRLDERVVIDWYVTDGQVANPDDVICKLVGPARALLSGERCALNFLQTLSAVATTTANYVKTLRGTKTRVLDTRKTIPGLRLAQKYAVTLGGGHNHRIGLFDAILIKENHIKSAGGIRNAVGAALAIDDEVLVEVEVESPDELREALDAGAPRVLLDNFTLKQLREAVAINRDYGRGAAELEASGNITLETIRDVAETGVDFVSTGALTKNIAAIDLSMLFSID